MQDTSENQIVADDDQADRRAEAADSTASDTGDADEQELTGWAAVYDFVMQSYCWTLIFFILYVLSIGPFYTSWRQAVDLGKSPVLQAVYLPLAALCSRSETLNTIVEWYVGLWS